MRWVEAAACRPHHCAVLPQIGNSNARGGFIDTGTELSGFDNHVYISHIACLQLGAAVGMKPIEDYQVLAAELEETRLTLREVLAERDELAERFAAIDVLASADFVARKKPGRPQVRPKTEGKVAA